MKTSEAFVSFFSYLKQSFSDNGTPSSSRLISGWLSVSSMALIWYIVRHAMYSRLEIAQAWIGGLPYIIGALAGFTVAPYGVNTVGNLFKKDDKKEGD